MAVKRSEYLRNGTGIAANPFAKKVLQLRAALMAAVTSEDILEIISALMAKAKKGDVNAIKEVLDRTIGRPIEPDVEEKIADMERMVRMLIVEKSEWNAEYKKWLEEHPEQQKSLNELAGVNDQQLAEARTSAA